MGHGRADDYQGDDYQDGERALPQFSAHGFREQLAKESGDQTTSAADSVP